MILAMPTNKMKRCLTIAAGTLMAVGAIAIKAQAQRTEVPLQIPHDWEFQDLSVDPVVLSSTLVEHGLELKTSSVKEQRV